VVRHCVLLRFTEDATNEQRAEARDALRALPATVDAIRDFSVGDDLGETDGNYDLAIVAGFDDTAGYATYRDHPDHVRVVRDLVRPILAARAAVQYQG
jgi:stress responsive alpha/beta barrel protein